MEIKIIFGILMGLVLMSGTAILSFSQTEEFSYETLVEQSSQTDFGEGEEILPYIPVVKILNYSTLISKSSNPDLEFETLVDDHKFSFNLKNKNNTALTELNVDYWIVSVSSPSWESHTRIDNPVTVNQILSNDTLKVAEFDLGIYGKRMEYYPGIYTIELIGYKWQEKELFGIIQQGFFKEHRVKTEVNIGYDVDSIKSNPNKLLRSDKEIELKVIGEENIDKSKLFEINTNFSRQISVILKNDENSGKKISKSVIANHLAIWKVDQRFPAIFSNFESTINDESCTYLDPGQSKEIEKLNFSRDNWPLGNNGLSKHFDKQIAEPGIYIVYYTITTSGCATSNSEIVEDDNHNLIFTVEVT